MPHIMESDAPVAPTDSMVRAEALALHLMNHLIGTAEMAHLDTATTSLFMLAEILAGLEVFAGFNPREAIHCVAQLTADRVDALRTIVADRGDHAEQDDDLDEADGAVFGSGLRVLH